MIQFRNLTMSFVVLFGYNMLDVTCDGVCSNFEIGLYMRWCVILFRNWTFYVVVFAEMSKWEVKCCYM